jgi:hypothetical protein
MAAAAAATVSAFASLGMFALIVAIGSMPLDVLLLEFCLQS